MSKKLQYFHNPRCSKSREGLNLLTDKDLDIEVIEYLKVGVSKVKIKEILDKLNLPIINIVRIKEKVFKELNLSKDSSKTDLIKAISEHPILLERPILLSEKRAAIGRPPENLLEII